MSEVTDAANDAGGEVRRDYDWVNKEVAAEVLKQTQAMIAAQHAASSAVDGKLSIALGQSVTLSVVAFGAATLPLAANGWMPAWVGFGLLVAGICAGIAAFIAARGLLSRRWVAPGIPPAHMASPSVLRSAPQTALMLMAWAYQDGIDENKTTAAGPARALRWTLLLLSVTPVVGALVAIAAWAALAH